MSTPDPEGMSLLAKILVAAGAIGTPIAGFIKLWNSKADKTETANCLRHIEKLYQNAEADRKLTRDLHDKAMEKVIDGQQKILEALARGRG